MDESKLSEDQLILELRKQDRRILALETKLAESRETLDRLSLLASFPEQNPNMVIEINLDGEVTYLNPIAKLRFPDLLERGFGHPMLRGLRDSLAQLREGEEDYIECKVDFGGDIFEQKICYLKGTRLLRIFVHDITALKQAEGEVQKMAAQLRELAWRVVNAQEEERRRISRELHDEAGQALTALKISLELIKGSLPPDSAELAQNLAEAIALTHTTRHHIRRLAQGLHPPVLDTLGIHLALEDLCQDFARRTRLHIDYQGQEIPRQSEAIHVCLYRFVQEALTNVVQHAEARHVWVELGYHPPEITLSVQDDGCGFEAVDPDLRAKTSSGLGLLGMQERLRLLDGWLEVESKDGAGLRLVAHVPVESRE